MYKHVAWLQLLFIPALDTPSTHLEQRTCAAAAAASASSSSLGFTHRLSYSSRQGRCCHAECHPCLSELQRLSQRKLYASCYEGAFMRQQRQSHPFKHLQTWLLSQAGREVRHIWCSCRFQTLTPRATTATEDDSATGRCWTYMSQLHAVQCSAPPKQAFQLNSLDLTVMPEVKTGSAKHIPWSSDCGSICARQGW